MDIDNATGGKTVSLSGSNLLNGIVGRATINTGTNTFDIRYPAVIKRTQGSSDVQASLSASPSTINAVAGGSYEVEITT